MAAIESSHVLLVDDSLPDAELTIHALRVNGRAPHVTWLSSADDALAFMFGREQYSSPDRGTPDLVLLDVDMPGMGGIGVLSRLKRDPRTRSVPIVMLSSNSDPTLVRRCYQLGANSYLVKPVAAVDYFYKIGATANYWLVLCECCEHAAANAADKRAVLSDPTEGVLDTSGPAMAHHRH